MKNKKRTWLRSSRSIGLKISVKNFETILHWWLLPSKNDSQNYDTINYITITNLINHNLGWICFTICTKQSTLPENWSQKIDGDGPRIESMKESTWWLYQIAVYYTSRADLINKSVIRWLDLKGKNQRRKTKDLPLDGDWTFKSILRTSSNR